MAEKIYNFICGRFGSRILKPRYRNVWIKFWASVIISLFLLVLYFIVQVWSVVVECLNRVIWNY